MSLPSAWVGCESPWGSTFVLPFSRTVAGLGCTKAAKIGAENRKFGLSLCAGQFCFKENFVLHFRVLGSLVSHLTKFEISASNFVGLKMGVLFERI